MKNLSLLSSIALLTAITSINGQIKDASFNNLEPNLIEWRHHLHQNPELSNREFKTAEYITSHLKSLGIDASLNRVDGAQAMERSRAYDFDLMNQCQVKRFLNKKNLIRIIWSLRG